jgi:hypothetical protein
VVTDHPAFLPVDRHRHRPGPRAGALGLRGCRHDQARPRQGVLVGHHDHRPRFPHFRQLRIKPEIAPINLAVLGCRFDPRLNAGRD